MASSPPSPSALPLRPRPRPPPRPPRLYVTRRGAPWTVAPSGPVTSIAFVRPSSLFSMTNSTGSSCVFSGDDDCQLGSSLGKLQLFPSAGSREKKYAAQSRTCRGMNRRVFAGRRAHRPTRWRSARWHRRDRSGTRERMRWTRGGASAGVGRRRPRAIPRGSRAEKSPGKRDATSEGKSFAGGSHLAQGAEALAVDGGLVHENLVGAVVGGDEAEALLGVEPLDLRARRGGRREVRRLRENSSIHAPARPCGCIHRHPVDRRPTADATRARLGRSSSAPCR